MGKSSPWSAPEVILDGVQPYRYPLIPESSAKPAVAQHSLLAFPALPSLAKHNKMHTAAPSKLKQQECRCCRCSVLESGLLLRPARNATAHGDAPPQQQSTADDGAEVQKLQKEKEQLEEQVRAAAKSIADLRAMNSKLHAFVVDSSVAEAGRTA